MEYEFKNPDFIEGNSEEEIQERMMSSLPEWIDNLPGGFPYDFTMPTAIEKAEIMNFIIPRILMTMFPQFAWGEWLDLHGEQVGIKRKNPTNATGNITVEGKDGTKIEKGTIFCTLATNDSSAIEFESIEEGIIINGTTTIKVVAIVSGVSSNVAANTVQLSLKPIEGVNRIWNKNAITGGTEEEDDEAFRTRIMEINKNKGVSFVGNISDYYRWAMEVDGVGSVTIIPTPDGVGGSVKIIVVDSNGYPATEQILQKVYQHIMAPDDPLMRLAPIGAKIKVVAPTSGVIHYSANVIHKENIVIESIVKSFSESVAKYYDIAKKEGVLRYSKISAILTNIDGVIDFDELKINNLQQNITLEKDFYPITGVVNFTGRVS